MRKTLAGISIGAGAAVLVLLADLLASALTGPAGLNPFQAVEMRTYDWRLTHTADPAAGRKDIALVGIDEYSLKKLEPDAGRWPWPRVIHSMLVDFLNRAPATLIVYDVDFGEADTRGSFTLANEVWSGAESDNALVRSIQKTGSVILPANATFEGEATNVGAWRDSGIVSSSEGIAERKVIFPPFGALGDAAAALGHNVFALDSDGPLRHTIPLVRVGARVMPSLALVAALRASKIDPASVRVDGQVLKIADRVQPLSWRTVGGADGPNRYLWGLINFRGPPPLTTAPSTQPYPTYSAYDLISAENDILQKKAPAIDPASFRDKIVFVGVTAAGLFDVFPTPFGVGKMPGIQINAAVVDDLLSNRFVTPGASMTRIAVVLVAALLVGVVAVSVPAWWATLVVGVAIAVFTWVTQLLMARGYWLNLSQPVLASSIALFGGVGYQYFVEGREKRKMKRLFGQYVSKDVFDHLVANPALAKLGGQRREMTVLFSDIRGFTTVTERGQPEEIVGMLNEYFTRMVEVVFRQKGTLDKFVGDMVMALFGAPLADADHADHAVDAALMMIEELGKLNQKWKAEGRFAELDIGIGVNTGPMIAGNIGSDQIMSYTVIGDAVNLGSRLESLNKQYGTRIIISEATRERLKGRYIFRPLGDVVVKGKTQPVAIFEVVGRDTGAHTSTDRPAPTHEAHS